MTRRTRGTLARAVLLTALNIGLVGALSVAAAQSTAQLLVTVLDADGAPVAGLTREDFTLRLDGVEREVVSVEPVEPGVQVVAIFEGLAATQRQTTAALTRFIASLDDDSIVDMQSVDGKLDAAIVEAVDDLHARGASRPVIVMIGQATEIVPSELQSSQVRGEAPGHRPVRQSRSAGPVAGRARHPVLWRVGDRGVAGELSDARPPARAAASR